MSWIRRSTLEDAVRIRAFLNGAMDRLPEAAHRSIGPRLDSHWQAALFELVVGRTLQELGATLEYETEIESGKHVDWLATFPDGQVGIEATVPLINASAGQILREQEPALALIEDLTPHGWTVVVVAVPAISANASRRPVRAVLERWIDRLADVDPSREAEYREDGLSGGTLHLIFRPVPGDPAIQAEPGGTFFDDSEERIRSAVERKKAQVSGAPWPVLLAVQGSALATDLGDYDQALLGRTVQAVNRDLVTTGVHFEATGVFGESRPEPPTLAGVLAFAEVSPTAASEPVLYPHPRSLVPLPEDILALAQHRFGGQGIEEVAASSMAVMGRLGLASPVWQ
jgi:hypothetical protein